MSRLYRRRGVQVFIFKDDDLFTGGERQRQWVRDFAAALRGSELAGRAIWRISTRVDEVDPGMLRDLMSAGLRALYLGIESGCGSGLRTCGKSFGEVTS